MLGVVLAGILLHSLFPRYEWRAVNDSGSALIVYDRWSGRFQRAEYDQSGKVKPMDVYAPF
jgi:hypothetical protein